MKHLVSRLLKIGALGALTATASAQMSVNLQMAQSQFLAGEAVLVSVTITNHTGGDLFLANSGRAPWLNMVVRRANGEPAAAVGRTDFGAMKIASGQSMSKTIDISGLYNLREPGSYSVAAVVQDAATGNGYTSNRLLFSCTNVRADWSQKVGVPGQSGKVHEFRVMNFTSGTRSMIYVQVVDDKRGVSLQTLNLGQALLFRKPQAAVDKSQNLHLLYLATPEFYIHARVDVNGRFLGRELHKRGASGDPSLMTFADGSVKVAGSILYDAKAEAEAKAKIRRISERPAYTYN